MTTAAPRGLDSMLADALADLANASVDLDPATRARLTALQGARLQLDVVLPGPLPDRSLALTVDAGRLRFHAAAVDRPQVILRGTPLGLLGWVLRPTDAASGLTIDGDVTLLQEFATLLRAFRPDLTVPLARVLGPRAASGLLGAAELAAGALTSALEGAGSSIRQGAAASFVDRAALERFLDELDELRLRTDRLAARVAAEEQRRQSP